MKTKLRLFAIPAAVLAILLASGCVSAPKEPETVPAGQTEPDAGTAASEDWEG